MLTRLLAGFRIALFIVRSSTTSGHLATGAIQAQVIRDFVTGTITIYFDGINNQQLQLNDKTPGLSRIESGCCDDMNAFDEIQPNANDYLRPHAKHAEY